MKLPDWLPRVLRVLAIVAAGVILYLHFSAPKSGPRAGNPAPDFEARLLGAEKPFRLADARGRVVLIDFWATWCPPCVKSLPALQKLHRRYAGDDGVLVLTVNDGSNADADLQRFLARGKYDFPVVVDTGEITRAYSVKSLPTTVLVGPDGTVREVFVGIGGRNPEQIEAHLAGAIEALRP
jgi:thiol-disulfide isomerase/thioredoxin